MFSDEQKQEQEISKELKNNLNSHHALYYDESSENDLNVEFGEHKLNYDNPGKESDLINNNYLEVQELDREDRKYQIKEKELKIRKEKLEIRKEELEIRKEEILIENESRKYTIAHEYELIKQRKEVETLELQKRNQDLLIQNYIKVGWFHRLFRASVSFLGFAIGAYFCAAGNEIGYVLIGSGAAGLGIGAANLPKEKVVEEKIQSRQKLY